MENEPFRERMSTIENACEKSEKVTEYDVFVVLFARSTLLFVYILSVFANIETVDAA